MAERRRGKYDALAERLGEQEGEEAEFSFGELNTLVGGLPDVARQDPTWWANTYASEQQTGWMPDWRVFTVDLDEQRVRFIRAASDRWQERLRDRRTDAQHAWLVRDTSTSGRSLVPDWIQNGHCWIATPGLSGNTSTRQAIAEDVAAAYAHLGHGSRSTIVATIHTFLNTMQVGDLVVTIGGDRGDKLYLGTVTGEPVEATDPEGRTGRRRDVAWFDTPRTPLDRDELREPLKASLRGQRTITDLTDKLEELKALAGIQEEPRPEPDWSAASQIVTPAPQSADLRLPDATGELASELLIPLDWLQETVELLRWKRQVIFYGPPGTSKTYVAKHLAEHVAGADYVRLVQFHPAYSYEDFFEGFRPQLAKDGSGQLVYDLAWGPLRRLVDEASKHPDRPYVLVIDEINRAHPAKVFGELYFLLDYRGEPIELMYSGEPDFRLPENIFLIGTMNTADRSIALVDVALRRRFAFRDLYPGRDPIKGLLREWLQREGHPERAADLLDELNRRIDEQDYAIGPSYFMSDQAKDGQGLRRIWRTTIIPLLDEHFHGRPINVEEQFGFDAVAAAVDANAQAAAGDEQPAAD